MDRLCLLDGFGSPSSGNIILVGIRILLKASAPRFYFLNANIRLCYVTKQSEHSSPVVVVRIINIFCLVISKKTFHHQVPATACRPVMKLMIVHVVVSWLFTEKPFQLHDI